SREILETYVRPRLEAFLSQRGLHLNENKTRILPINVGFDFLGFRIQKQGRKLLIVPQKQKVQGHLRHVKEYLQSHRHTPAAQVLNVLNPVIRGWANYYQHVCAKETFSRVRHEHWRLLWRWAKRRHPNKSSTWVKTRYFRDDGWWTFATGREELFRPDRLPLRRHTKRTRRPSPHHP